jgi:hypothetical protein
MYIAVIILIILFSFVLIGIIELGRDIIIDKLSKCPICGKKMTLISDENNIMDYICPDIKCRCKIVINSKHSDNIKVIKCIKVTEEEYEHESIIKGSKEDLRYQYDHTKE